jgi:hypothetical protein
MDRREHARLTWLCTVVHNYGQEEAYRMNKVRFAIYLEKPQAAKLLKLSEETGAPVTELVRRALAEYLKKEGRS